MVAAKCIAELLMI